MSHTHDIVFYDGACGLCHRSVRFILKRDRNAAFRFAPLDSEVFRRTFQASERASLPDSVIIRAADGQVLMRWSGVRYVLKRLGGFWAFAGAVMGLIPRAVGDWLYDQIARTRHRFFKKPEAACPMVPPELRERFLS